MFERCNGSGPSSNECCVFGQETLGAVQGQKHWAMPGRLESEAHAMRRRRKKEDRIIAAPALNQVWREHELRRDDVFTLGM